jgi:predicted phage tail protein
VWFSRIIIGLFAIAGVAMAVGVISYGPGTNDRVRTTASVDDCNYVSGGTRAGVDVCTGTWQIGGRTIHGRIDDVDVHDLFKTVTVYANAHVAHAPHATNWALAGLGIVMAIGGVVGLVANERQIRRRRGAANPSGLAGA